MPPSGRNATRSSPPEPAANARRGLHYRRGWPGEVPSTSFTTQQAPALPAWSILSASNAFEHLELGDDSADFLDGQPGGERHVFRAPASA